MPFLLKTEPNKYSFDDLERDGETVWDGISNPQALLYLRGMKKGEQLVIYHSTIGKAAIGTAKVVSVDATAKTMTVKAKSGDMNFSWDDKTTVGPKGKTAGDIAMGTKVTVSYKMSGDTKMATKVMIHAAKAAKMDAAAAPKTPSK